MVLATGNDNAARIWSTDTSRELHVLTGHTGKVYAGAFTDDSERVFTAAHDRTIKVWNVSSGYCKATVNCGSLCNYLGLSGAVEMVATAHLDTHIRLWSAKTNELLHDFEDIHSQQTTCAEFSADGSMVLPTHAPRAPPATLPSNNCAPLCFPLTVGDELARQYAECD